MTRITSKIASTRVLKASSREAATKAVLSRVMAIFNPGGKLGSSSAIFSFTSLAVFQALEPGN